MPVRRQRSHTRVRSAHLRTAVGVFLVLVALALGGAHPAVNLVLAAGLLTVLGLYLALKADRPGIRLGPALVLVVAALVLTVSQVVGLPVGLFSWLSPKAHEIVTLPPLSRATWAPLSLDAAATCHELIKLATYAAGAVLAVQLFSGPRHERRLLFWISVSGVVVVGVGLVQEMVHLDRPWGLFGPAGSGFVTTLVNPNHQAALLGLSSLVSLTLAITAKRIQAWAYLGASVLTGAGVFFSLSRGGMVAFVCALGFLGVSLGLRSRTRRRHLWLVQGVLLAALAVGGPISYGKIVHELWSVSYSRTFNKVLIWEPVPQMLRDFPLTGVGRGAFAAIYPHYRAARLSATFTHLENEPLQALVDFGPVAGGVLLVGLAICFGLIFVRRSHDPLGLGAAAGLLFLAAHNLVDFALELTGLALPAIMLLAVFSARPQPSSRERPGVPRASAPGRHLGRKWAWAGWGVVALITLISAGPALFHSLGRDGERLRTMLRRADGLTGPYVASAQEIMARHPADYLFPLLVAQHQLRFRGGARAALPWINRALFLAPAFAPAHALAGKALWRLGARDQAVLELSLACEQMPSTTRALAQDLWQLSHGDASMVARLAGTDPSVRAEVAGFLLSRGRAEVVVALGRDRDPAKESELFVERLGRALIRRAEYDDAVAVAQKAQSRWPQLYKGYLLEAEALENDGRRPEAIAALDRGIQQSTLPILLMMYKGEFQLREGELDVARQTARDMVERAASGRHLAWGYSLLGRIYEREGSNALAIREMTRARELDPSNHRYPVAIARWRIALGDRNGALAELRRARSVVSRPEEIDRVLAKHFPEPTEK